jgi:hypothetical protein
MCRTFLHWPKISKNIYENAFYIKILKNSPSERWIFIFLKDHIGSLKNQEFYADLWMYLGDNIFLNKVWMHFITQVFYSHILNQHTVILIFLNQ